MKRLITLASVAAFLVVLPASHLLMGGGPTPKITICHLTAPANSGNADGTGVIISVSSTHARNGHSRHSDCVEGGPLFTDNGDGTCSCRGRF